MDVGLEGVGVVQKISSNIQQLNACVNKFNVCVENIGRPEDNERMRQTMSRLIAESNTLSKATGSLMKNLVTLSNDNREYRVQRDRLMDEYMSVLNKLQSAQRTATQKERAQIKAVTVEDQILSSQSEERQAYHQEDHQAQMQLQEQHRQHLNEIRERQQTLSQLEVDISDVNQIFKDLARIVHDQGEMVDSIEANIEHASIHVEQGHANVEQALYYQTKSRQKKLLLFIFLGALTAILLLFLFLWSRG